MTQIDHLRKLIYETNHRLQVLKLQEAKKGQDTPPHIITEIEDLEKKLSDFEAQLLKTVKEEEEFSSEFGVTVTNIAPKPTGVNYWPVIPWILLVVIAVINIYLLLMNQPSNNRSITLFDFEGADDGWSQIVTIQKIPDPDDSNKEIEISRFPPDPSFPQPFPGLMESNLTSERALTGQQSLKVVTSINGLGEFKGWLYRPGSTVAYGAAIYVLIPDLNGIDLQYLQFCVSKLDWACSAGTQPEVGKWTPITVDLSQSTEGHPAWYKEKITEMAVQWRYKVTKPNTSLIIYFDSAQIFHAEP